MSRPKLIAIDIDGTLVDSQVKLDPEVKNAVLRAKEDGALVTLATGRMVSAASKYIDALEIDLPLVALNGVFVGWKDNCREPIYHEAISHHSAQAIVHAVWNSKSTLLCVHCDRAFGRNIDDLTGPAISTWIVNVDPLEEIDSLDGIEPSTILIAGNEEIISELYTNAEGIFRDDTERYFFPSMRYYPMHYLEIRARGTNKGKGLRKLAEYLGIRAEEVLAIGDYINDFEMAQYAGIFAAPANAHDEIKEIADYVSPSTNDGAAVSEIINKLYFGAN